MEAFNKYLEQLIQKKTNMDMIFVEKDNCVYSLTVSIKGTKVSVGIQEEGPGYHYVWGGTCRFNTETKSHNNVLMKEKYGDGDWMLDDLLEANFDAADILDQVS